MEFFGLFNTVVLAENCAICGITVVCTLCTPVVKGITDFDLFG